METEENSDYNKGIAPIVKILYNLRTIEHSQESIGNKYKQAKPLLEKVTDKLMATKNFLAYRPMWEELHDRMVYYYNYCNEENFDKPIPFFSVSLHNEAVPLWLKVKKVGKLSNVLVHFDTHDDMGLPEKSECLLKEDGSLDEQGMMNGSCGQIYWPVTCLLMSKGVDTIVWGMPKWVYDDDNHFKQTLVCDKKDEFRYIRSSKENKDNFLLEPDVEIVKPKNMKDSSKYKLYHPHTFCRLKLYNASGWKKLEKIISKVPDKKFVLDIDLDFFVTNGDKVSMKEYKENFDDIESTGRVHYVPGMTTPRETYNDQDSIDCNKDLLNELKLVKKRVEVFLEGLAILKSKGIKPCCIDISDSAPSFFSGDTSRAVFTNQYTPKYFVPVLHMWLKKGFKKLYRIDC
jgi:hypothetical protein|tara:strand:- start:789 stop:1994 length:1206 start_codon:yes stop_codon:yes gene_type:complete